MGLVGNISEHSANSLWKSFDSRGISLKKNLWINEIVDYESRSTFILLGTSEHVGTRRNSFVIC